MSTGGKGSRRRKSQVNYQQFSTNWDIIFGKKQSATAEVEKACCQANKCCGCDCDKNNCCCEKKYD